MVVKVTSQDSGRVIRQIPPEDYLHLIAKFRELFGVLVDETV